MLSLQERLEKGAEILILLDRRRAETGDENLGASIERALLDAHLAELETTAQPAPFWKNAA